MSEFLPPVGPDCHTRPESPSAGILERSDAWWEHDRDMGRAYLGALLFWRPGCHGGKIDRKWLSSDLHLGLYDELGAGFPWGDTLKALTALRTGQTAKRFGASVVRAEIEACCANTAEWEEVPVIVQALEQGWKRRERVRLLTDALTNAHDKDCVDNAARFLLEI